RLNYQFFPYTTLFRSYLGYVILFFAAATVNGLGSGAWDGSSSMWLVELWPHQTGAVMQSYQFMFGLGNIVAPLIAAPYLHGEDTDRKSTRLNSSHVKI